MSRWRQLISIAIVVAMVHLTLVDAVCPANSGPPNPATVRQQVGQFGVGAKVKIRLATGKKLNGTIQAIEDDRFLVKSKDSSTMPVAYEQVAQLKLAKNTYKSKGSVDQDEARRVVTALGVGRHIMVKTAGGQEYHGRILAIGSESFTLLPDNQRTPVQVAYDDTFQLGPNLSKGAKIAIGVGVAVLVFIIVAIAVTKPWQSE